MRALRFAKYGLVAPMLLLLVPGHVRAQHGTVMPGAAAGSVAPELEFMRSVQAELVAGKFDDLDRTADQLRRDKTRLKGGAWKLHLFYNALDAPELTDQDSTQHLDRLKAWMVERPASITARVALATSYLRWAWVARGSGLARTVTMEQWKKFNERTLEAQIVLDGSADMRSMCPQFYLVSMGVGLAQNWDAARMRETFERGVQFEPEYFYLYTQYANYLLPKWDGKPGEASAFAGESADKLGGDTGDTLYFLITASLIRRGDGNFPISQLDWARIQRGYQGLTSQYGQDWKAANELAFMAYMFKDPAVARQQFALIGNHWGVNVWGGKDFFDRVRDWSQGS